MLGGLLLLELKAEHLEVFDTRLLYLHVLLELVVLLLLQLDAVHIFADLCGFDYRLLKSKK